MKNIKEYRMLMNCSQNELAMLTGLSKRTIQNFEQYPERIEKTSCENAAKLFQVLPVTVEEYFSYLNIKEIVVEKMSLWNEKNPLDINFSSYKARIYNHFYSKYRKNVISKNDFEIIKSEWKTISDSYIKYLDKEGILPYEYYFEFTIEKYDKATKNIKKYMIINGITNDMVAYIMDKNVYYIRNCQNGLRNFSGMGVIPGLKLCYLLNVTFKDIFY